MKNVRIEPNKKLNRHHVAKHLDKQPFDAMLHQDGGVYFVGVPDDVDEYALQAFVDAMPAAEFNDAELQEQQQVSHEENEFKGIKKKLAKYLEQVLKPEAFK